MFLSCWSKYVSWMGIMPYATLPFSNSFHPGRLLLTRALALGAMFVPLLASSTQASPDSFRDFYGPRFRGNQSATRGHGPRAGLDSLHRWNQIAIDATGLDHTPVAAGETRVFGEQLGPARASRAMAIIHIAIFDAVSAISGRYQSYTGLPAAARNTSMEAAIAQAAHDTLSALFPSQKAAFDEQLAQDLDAINGRRPRELGIELGQRAAAAILSLR